MALCVISLVSFSIAILCKSLGNPPDISVQLNIATTKIYGMKMRNMAFVFLYIYNIIHKYIYYINKLFEK